MSKKSVTTDDAFHIPNLNDMFKPIDLYFEQSGVLYYHQHHSFNQFIEKIIPSILTQDENIFYEKATDTKIYRYRFEFKDFAIRPPTLDGGEREMYPYHAMINRLNYVAEYTTTVTQIQDIIDITTGEVKTKIIDKPEKDIPIAKIPIMVKSKYCNLSLNPDTKVPNTRYDPGGYFIIKGSEKVVLTVEEIVQRKILVFPKKEQNMTLYKVEVRSRPYQQYVGNVHTFTVKQKKDESLVLSILQFKDVSIFTFLKALGIESDQDIINMVVYNKNDEELLNKLIKTMNIHYTQNPTILTREKAIEQLIGNMKASRAYSDTDPEIKAQQKRRHLMKILTSYILPHITSPADNPEAGLYRKACYIGLMICKLLRKSLGRIDIDDRDSFENKRFETPGILMGQLFQQHFKRMLNECKNFFTRKNTGTDGDANPISIIQSIKSSTIEQGLRQALSTGNWGSKNRKGFAQMLSRFTLLQTTSYMRRIISASIDASTNKSTSIRHLHSTHYGYVCPIETPEGPKTGIVKNLALMSSITINSNTQADIIKNYLRDRLIQLEDAKTREMKTLTKVFLNGDWLGFTKNPIELHHSLREMRFKGIIEKTVSLIYDFKNSDIRIYTEGGRMYRPLLTVDNFKLNYDPSMLEGIATWSEFLEKNPRVVEYLDVEESTMNSMLAPFPKTLLSVYQKWKKQFVLLGADNKQLNRYDENVFVRYTHCEFNPSMAFGVVACNIPFMNHNPSPRAIYQYAQAKQAMGVYMLDYRYRIDISYVLFNPQLPIISTRASKYTDSHIMPAGTNVIVAIASYTGYNQEDSLLINASAIDKGLYVANSLKKEHVDLDKNSSASQVETFMKPDPNKVEGMKVSNYDKLNEKGYVQEETRIEDNDVIVGICTPIPPGPNSDKTYRDSSRIYKATLPATVNKVYADITNQDGYPALTMSLRSIRHPNIGDKFASRSGQKATIGLKLHRSDMPFTSRGIIPDIIINPNCIPGRMTAGHLIEMLKAKVCVAKGQLGDGSPFGEESVKKLNDELIAMGFMKYANDIMYNGMTGQRMEVPIFIAPIYYLRLKHMVYDKVHSRDRGPVQILTRAPTEGRSRDGGLRFGEMERDAICAHGAAQFLKERLVDVSDPYVARICNICGMFAHKAPDHNYYICTACTNTTRISTVVIPYAWKLFTQELMSMNILPRMRTRRALGNVK